MTPLQKHIISLNTRIKNRLCHWRLIPLQVSIVITKQETSWTAMMDAISKNHMRRVLQYGKGGSHHSFWSIKLSWTTYPLEKPYLSWCKGECSIIFWNVVAISAVENDLMSVIFHPGTMQRDSMFLPIYIAKPSNLQRTLSVVILSQTVAHRQISWEEIDCKWCFHCLLVFMIQCFTNM